MKLAKQSYHRDSNSRFKVHISKKIHIIGNNGMQMHKNKMI